MSRLTDIELAILEKSKTQVAGNMAEHDLILWQAQQERNRYINKLLSRAWRASGAATLLCSVKRALSKRRTVAALQKLDDRQLRDIGLERWEIEHSSLASSQEANPYPASWITRLGRELKRAAARRRSIAQLRALDDRILQDIGIERAAIPAMVDARLEERTTVSQQDAIDPPQGQSSLSLRFGAALLLPLYLATTGAANSNDPLRDQVA